MNVWVLGKGKAGSCLAAALRKAGWSVTLRSGRRALPRKIAADVLIVAVRDGRIEGIAGQLGGRLARSAVVLHLAGGLGPEVLAGARGGCRGVGQMHPLVAFADAGCCPDLRGAYVHVSGDREAVRAARTIARALGMRALTVPGLDPGVWHAAGGMVASGAAALVEVGMQVLQSQGIDRRRASAMLGALVRSVAQNVLSLGLPLALTGVVRRGDVARAQAHLGAIGRISGRHLGLYREILAAQLPMARALGEAAPGDLDRLRGLASGRVEPGKPRAARRRGMRKA